jgi:hypothetical protein
VLVTRSSIGVEIVSVAKDRFTKPDQDHVLSDGLSDPIMEFFLRVKPSQKALDKISWVWVWNKFETADVASPTGVEC